MSLLARNAYGDAKNTLGSGFGLLRESGGRVDTGCWAVKQASLCCCLKNCNTISLSLLSAASSHAVADLVLAASFLHGGVAKASFRTDLQ